MAEQVVARRHLTDAQRVKLGEDIEPIIAREAKRRQPLPRKEPPMTYWIRWQGAGGGEGPRIGPFDHRQEAEAARRAQVRAAADALEYGTGKAGTCTPDGALYHDDLFDRFLGRYVIIEDERAADAAQGEE